MENPIVFTPDCLRNVSACFSDKEELITFMGQMGRLIEDLSFSMHLSSRIKNEDTSAWLILEQACAFCFYCREHIDLIQQIISKLEYREISDQELKDLGA